MASIADRRNQKLDSKLKHNSMSRSQQIQLPNIKDTSEGDVSVQSEARAPSDIASLDFEGPAHDTAKVVGHENLQRQATDINSLKSILPSVSEMQPPALMRQTTCQVEPSNFFATAVPKTVSAQESQNSSSKKKKADGSLHGRWTDQEHRLFLEGMHLFKKDWRSIERHIGTRTCSQIRSHAQKYFMRIEKTQGGN